MTTLTIQMKCDTRAFGRTPTQKAFEIARILRTLERDVTDNGLTLSNGHIKLIEHNGNSVGMATYEVTHKAIQSEVDLINYENDRYDVDGMLKVKV